MQSEKNNRLYIYYLITAAIFLLLKLYHSGAETHQLLFLIKPVAKFVEVATGFSSVYIHGSGYYFAGLNIVIDKSCSGFNFACLTFLILNFLAFKYIYATKVRIWVFPVALLFSYVAALVVNSSRIMLAIILSSRLPVSAKISPSLVHLGEGVFVYLFFLILIYIVTDYLLSKLQQRYEKLT